MHRPGKVKKVLSFTLIVAFLSGLLLYSYTFLHIAKDYSLYEGAETKISPLLPITMELEAGQRQELSLNSDHLEGGVVVKSSAAQQQVRNYSAQVKLFGLLPVKSVNIHVLPRMKLAPSGHTMGIKMMTDGVIVVGMNDITVDGKKSNPAYDAGIRTKDIILEADGKKLENLEELTQVLEKSNGNAVELTVKRKEAVYTTNVFPQKPDGEAQYRMGVWVRDSAAGIGTITFVDTQSGLFGGLGHGITDTDTGEIMHLGEGVVQKTTIVDVKRGARGEPGELCGMFENDEKMGTLLDNQSTGVYGTMEDSVRKSYAGQEMDIALKEEIKAGPAKVLCTVEGSEPKQYDIEIVKVNEKDSSGNKNMMICVTDPELLKITGGIVQGMSGSPIIQEGRLVGAVTHVLVNDPTRGYGIFIENMLKNMELIPIGSGQLTWPQPDSSFFL